MLIRAATKDDVVQVAIIDASWPTTPRWTSAQFLKEASDSKAVCLVSDLDGKVAGFLFAWVVGGELQIHNVAVDPGTTRKGFGRALLRAALAEGARRGAASAHLEVADGNAAAIGLYQSEGFRVVGRRPNFYDGRRDALTMSRSLP